jgi:hypothetical protein
MFALPGGTCAQAAQVLPPHWPILGVNGGVLSLYKQHEWLQDTTCPAAGGALAGGRQPRPLTDVGRRCGNHGIRHAVFYSGARLCATALAHAGQLAQFAFAVYSWL